MAGPLDLKSLLRGGAADGRFSGRSRARRAYNRRRCAAAAAVLGEVAEQIVHGAIFGSVKKLAAEPALGDQARVVEFLEMKGQRSGKDAELVGDCAGGK